ncbi:MAG TPA: S-layer homology domain-containing protein [Candidatus Galloscillospira excrementavium]|nr:S-layer homology domain-containing protein [Candidatus Galloscillospira excrementavium]
MKKALASLFLAAALCVSLAVPALADVEMELEGDYASGAYTYDLREDGTALIITFNKNLQYPAYSLTDLVIPSELDGHKVTAIGNYSFSYWFPAGVESITIPEGVEYIYDNAFLCPQAEPTVTELNLPSTLKLIGSAAFSNHTALRTLVIPENVEEIRGNAFFTMEPDENHGLKTVICYSRDVDFNVRTLYDSCAFTGVRNAEFYGYPGSTLETLYKTHLDEYYSSTQQPDGSWKEEWLPTGNVFLDIANAPDVTIPDEPEEPEEPVTPAFTDVAADAWYAEPVAWAVEKDITGGTTPTTFSPDSTCTTAQILTFLWRAMGEPAAAGNPFSNVSDSEYYAGAASWAHEKGLVSGTTFDAGAPCTRSMVAEYLWKLEGSPATGGNPFTDVAADASYAQAVAWAAEQGITGGTTPTTFSPASTCTRGQIVTFLFRALAE